MKWCLVVLLLICATNSFAQLKSIYKTEPNTGHYESQQEAAIFRNGFFYIAGASDDNIYDEPAIYKVDAEGNLIWTSTYVNDAYPELPFPNVHPILASVNFLADGLYAFSREELLKLDTLTGQLIWKLPINTYELADFGFYFNYLKDFNEEHFIFFNNSKVEIRRYDTGELVNEYTNPDTQNDWKMFDLDNEKNIYFVKGDSIVKYDSAFHWQWSTLIKDANFSYIAYHESSQKIIVTSSGRPWAYTVSTATGQILSSQKLGLSLESGIVMKGDLREQDAAYLLWRFSASNGGGGVMVTKLSTSTGDTLWNRKFLFDHAPYVTVQFDVEVENIYISAIQQIYPDIIKDLKVLKLNKHTGNLEFSKDYFKNNGLIHLEAHSIKAVGNLLNVHCYQYFGNPDNQYKRSAMIAINKTNGDSLNYVEFPGTMQYPTYTKQMLTYDQETFLAVNQLREVTEIVLYDHSLNEISSFSVPITQVSDIAITKDRIAIMATAYGPGSVPTEMNTFSNRYFRLYTYDGQLVYGEELEHNQTYEVASHQDVILMTIRDDPYGIWQVFQDSLVELIPSADNIGTFDKRLIPWRDTSSIFLDRIFSAQVKGLGVNFYNAENARFVRIDTLVNSSLIGASGIFQDQLYLSTSLMNHPTSTKVFFRYDINTEKKIWEHIDRAYGELYVSGQVLYGLNNANPGILVDGIDPNTGLVLWQQIIPVDYNKKKAKLDSTGNQLLVYDFVDEEFGKEFISLYQASASGEINQPFRYSGAKPRDNHLHDILPFVHHQELFYLTSGAFFHPELHKTAFINLYSGNQLSTPIRLNVFFDKNENKVKDVDEINIEWGYLLVNSAARIYLHNQDLNFYPRGIIQDTIQYFPLNGWYFTTDSVQFINSTDTSIVYFGISTDHEIDSITPVMTAVGRWRCNRSVEISIQAFNDGTSKTDGVIKAVIPDKFTFINSSDPIDHTDGDTLFFSFTDLNPDEYRTIILNVKVPGSEFNSDTFEFKEIVEFQGGVTSQTKKMTTAVKDIVRCGYDPNDKLVNPMRGDNNPILKDEDIHYTIRFQNTGNDTTFRVEILDTLSQYLDVSNLKILSSSHQCDVTLQDHILKAVFMPIQLPDSTTDYLASQGFLHFSIRALDGLPDYTIIENQATIYFEFNPGVLTNTATSTLVSEFGVGIKNSVIARPMKVIPSPANSFVFLLSDEFENHESLVTITDAYGRTLLKATFVFGERVDISQLPAGMYLAQVAGYQTQKFVKTK